MSEQHVDTGRRRFLTVATSAVGGVAAAGVAVPFLMSFAPSERAKAAGAPVEVDISKLEPGQKINVEWRGKPVWVLSRTPEQLKNLATIEGELLDPGQVRSSIARRLRLPLAEGQPAASAEAVYLRWQSRDAGGRTSRLSAVHRVALNTAGLRSGDNSAVKAGDNTVGTGNSPLQAPR